MEKRSLLGVSLRVCILSELSLFGLISINFSPLLDDYCLSVRT